MSENAEVKKETKTGLVSVRLSKEEDDMVKILKSHPHYINLAEYIRACIHHLYESKITKAGRPK